MGGRKSLCAPFFWKLRQADFIAVEGDHLADVPELIKDPQVPSQRVAPGTKIKAPLHKVFRSLMLRRRGVGKLAWGAWYEANSEAPEHPGWTIMMEATDTPSCGADGVLALPRIAKMAKSLVIGVSWEAEEDDLGMMVANPRGIIASERVTPMTREYKKGRLHPDGPPIPEILDDPTPTGVEKALLRFGFDPGVFLGGKSLATYIATDKFSSDKKPESREEEDRRLRADIDKDIDSPAFRRLVKILGLTVAQNPALREVWEKGRARQLRLAEQREKRRAARKKKGRRLG
ncbi:MAG: hypothetical protein IPK83_24365 [Planctomycetes bacterium]|nr:hypothetical protein [Planctomycetota bacterium]